MQASTERILVTHVGSLPRSQAVTDVLFARDRGEALDEAAASATIAEAVRDVVRRQVEAGVDVVSDGEMSKISYATYIKDRAHRFRRRYAARAGAGPGRVSAHPEAARGERRDCEIHASALRRRDPRTQPAACADGRAEHEGRDGSAVRRPKRF